MIFGKLTPLLRPGVRSRDNREEGQNLGTLLASEVKDL